MRWLHGSRRQGALTAHHCRSSSIIGVVPRDSREDNHNQLGEDLSRYLVVKAGDIVFNKLRTWQGGLGYSKYDGIVSPAYYVCRPTSGIDARYLHYLLKSTPYLAELTRISKWMPPSQFDTPWDMLRRLPVVMPPADEQRRIADFLDAEVGVLRKIADLSRRVSQLVLERKFAIVNAAFERGHPDFASESFSLSPLRRVISKWVDYRGATPEKSTSGIPLVTARNIKDGAITFRDSREFISEDRYHDWMRRGLPQSMDILLTTEAPLGQVALVENRHIALAQRVILLRVDSSRIQPHWLYWYLQSHFGQFRLTERATGSTALGIKADRLRGLPIPLFLPAEMSNRLKWLAARIAGVDDLASQLDRQVGLLNARRQALITAAVTGEIDVATARGFAS